MLNQVAPPLSLHSILEPVLCEHAPSRSIYMMNAYVVNTCRFAYRLCLQRFYRSSHLKYVVETDRLCNILTDHDFVHIRG